MEFPRTLKRVSLGKPDPVDWSFRGPNQPFVPRSQDPELGIYMIEYIDVFHVRPTASRNVLDCGHRRL